MKIKQLIGSAKAKIVGAVTAGFALAATGAHATALIANDTLEGLPELGSDVGDFMGNLAPGLFKFILLMGLGVAIVGVIVAVIFVVRKKATHSVR